MTTAEENFDQFMVELVDAFVNPKPLTDDERAEVDELMRLSLPEDERCPSGCGCARGEADARDCACDGPCVFDDDWRTPADEPRDLSNGEA